MKGILGYIRQYFHEANKWVLTICTFFIALLIVLNYSKGLENYLITHSSLPYAPITGHWIIYSAAFLLPYCLIYFNKKKSLQFSKTAIVCLLISPLLFALKAGIDTTFHFSDNNDWNSYWNTVLYWPIRLLLVFFLLFIVQRWLNPDESFYGLKTQPTKWKPYITMLLIMLPLIAIASTQADFLAVYPKMKRVLPLPDGATPSWLYKILFEATYGSDFISIELFFRGFLIVGLAKWFGKEAILPMACFYCSIHFGKPLGECISSYFGGLLLGIVSYHTRSIYGGLMVHLGIAWLMEAGGYIGNTFLKW